MQANILVADDDDAITRMCQEVLARQGCNVSPACSAEVALEEAGKTEFDAILLDIRMHGMSGLEALTKLKQMATSVDTPVILITGHATVESAIEALRGGAYDYLCKPLDVMQLVHTVSRALELTRLRREVRGLREQLDATFGLGLEGLVGSSSSMRKLCEMIMKIAPLQTGCVLLTGETGTGKGVIARTIHNLGVRSSSPFIHLNCTSIPGDLFEAELFGYEPGAFTDANHRRIGCVESAHRGTLFLDEIGDLPLTLQSKLLHVIEEKKIRRLGLDKLIDVDVRFIAASNRNLEAMVQSGTFREDLFYRLNTIPLSVPPLRERREDVLPLAKHFIVIFNREFNKHIRGLATETEDQLLNHPWPGNVRELRNTIERAVLFEEGTTLSPEHIIISRMQRSEEEETTADRHIDPEQVQEALATCDGNKSRAAQLLGISRQTLYNKLRTMGLSTE